MTVIDKPKFDPTKPGEAQSATAPELDASVDAVASPNTMTGSTPATQGGKPLTPPITIQTTTNNADQVKRLVGGKRKFASTSSDVFEPRPITSLPSLEEAYDPSAMSKRLRALDGTSYGMPPRPTKAIHITVRPMIGEPFSLSISDDSYIFELKEMICERLGLTLHGIVLSFPNDGGRVLDDDEAMLATVGLTEGSTLNLTVRVTSGLEPAINFDYDFGDVMGLDDYDDDDDNVEFYDVVYPIGGDTDSPEGLKNQETLAEFVRLLEADNANVTIEYKKKGGVDGADGSTPSSSSSPVKVMEVRMPGNFAALNKVLDSLPRPAAPVHDVDLDSLKISNSEEEDRYHDELIRSALGPRGAAIFTSPTLSPAPEDVPITSSSLTGASSCAKCGRKCKLAQRFECKCGRTFCPQHRYYDQHACTFDFKAGDRAKVEAANPRVVKSKIDQI